MGYPPLLPLKSANDKHAEFAITDIEATKWTNFLCIGFCTKVDGEWFYKDFTSLDVYFDFLFSPANPRKLLYAHFGGKYDFLFLMEKGHFSDKYVVHDIIPRGSSILTFSVSSFKIAPTVSDPKDPLVLGRVSNGWMIKDKTIEFRDSSALLPFSLRSLCESFKVDHKKLEVDYEKITEVTPELLEYMEYDHKGLYEVMEKYYEWPLIKVAGGAHTMASQAMKVFRLFLQDTIYSLKDNIDDFVRESYFGGRTEIFKPLFMGDNKNLLKCFDVNSLYPTIMANNEMPTNFQSWTWTYYPNKMGFYDAEVEVPEDMYIPPLPTMAQVGKSTKLIFPTGRFKGRWSTIELEYAKSLGVKVLSTGKGIIFKNGGYLFKDYVEHLYKIRQESEKGSVSDMLAKLLMNSCYGRFGLRRDREEVSLDDGQLGAKPVGILRQGKKAVRLVSTPKIIESSFSNVSIAAWVTSHARIFLHKILMEAPEDIYYCDTDSAFTTHQYKVDNTGLGGLKLEYNVARACFLLPKTYIVNFAEQVKGVESKVVMKGFDKKKVQHFGIEDFRAALEGDLRRMKATNPSKMASFKLAIRKGEFLRMLDEQPREIRSMYDKRIIVKTKDGFDTIPLHMENGRITNWEKGLQNGYQIKAAAEKALAASSRKRSTRNKV